MLDATTKCNTVMSASQSSNGTLQYSDGEYIPSTLHHNVKQPPYPHTCEVKKQMNQTTVLQKLLTKQKQ